MQTKMKRLLLPLLAAIALPNAVNAELVYLECYFPKQKTQKETTMEVTLNEEQGKVTYLIKTTGSTKTLPATFSQEYILFSEEYISWQIDRTNGEITNKFYTFDPAYGNCKKTEKTKTLF